MSEAQATEDASSKVTEVTEAVASAEETRDLDYKQAQLAYSIMEMLLEHTNATGDLIALMAQALDEETLKALTNTPHWTTYLESRRSLSRAKDALEEFTTAMQNLHNKNQD
ncbi:MAG: hypothetical protein ACRD63_13070 [Pyrinomonadaceae bacterium]